VPYKCYINASFIQFYSSVGVLLSSQVQTSPSIMLECTFARILFWLIEGGLSSWLCLNPEMSHLLIWVFKNMNVGLTSSHSCYPAGVGLTSSHSHYVHQVLVSITCNCTMNVETMNILDIKFLAFSSVTNTGICGRNPISYSCTC
jgi:hypothetical protein